MIILMDVKVNLWRTACNHSFAFSKIRPCKITIFFLFFSPSNYLPFQHSFFNSNPFFFKTKSQNLSTPANISKQKELPVLFKNSLFQNKSQNLPILFKTNNTFFTSDFLFFLFPFFQYSSDAVVTNNEIY